MPEGHTIHGLAGRLNRAFAGKAVTTTSPQGRFADAAALLDGTVHEHAEAAGKHLFVTFAGDRVVHVHLGLIGNFAVAAGPAEEVPVVGAVRWRISDAGHTADLRGPNTCALVDPTALARTLSTLGPDPLRDDADPDRAWDRIRRTSRPIGELLMDQAVVAGVGNVYRCELLFRHGIDPFTPGCDLPRASWQAIWDDLVRLLPLGMVYNQILTMPDQVEAAEADLTDPEVLAVAADLTGRHLGERYERRFFLYQRGGEPCVACGTPVATKKAAGRTLYWCPTCQRGR